MLRFWRSKRAKWALSLTGKAENRTPAISIWILNRDSLTSVRWYITFEAGIPQFIVPLCEELSLSWSIIKNSTEGSSSPAGAAQNELRERFVISFPEDLDGLPEILEEPVLLKTQNTIEAQKVGQKCNAFDSLSSCNS
jgi:hypothetical protein